MRNMVVTTIVLYKAGYFLSIPKCMLIPEQVMTYLGVECDTIRCRFRVPQERADKYLLVLSKLLSQKKVSFAELESIVGNKGLPWRSFSNIYFQADISSDALGRSFAGKVDFPQGTNIQEKAPLWKTV